MARIAIIGGGNMGEALLAGLLRAGRQVKDLVLSEKSSERAEFLSQKYSVRVASLADAVENAAYVILAVKPADVEYIIGEIANAAGKAADDAVEQVLVSVAAGVTTGFYESHLPAGSPVIRAMPNAPALVGAGITALAKGRFGTAEQLSEAAALFECVGSVLIVPEAQIDTVTAVSGSGPAYFFLFLEALVDAGVTNGLSRTVATELAVQTMAGSVAMLLDRIESGSAAAAGRPDTTAAELRALVTSPGGTTAAGLRELERGGVRAAVAAAVDAAKTRSEQLGITSE
ncbi:pyrroline-5-carboxylate reductase [Mycolicibacterium sp.]|uniref:pyrroline-5-carboxylate reductase n=1 Tax=Mycolicibacterium sp. TaxID=2320850 RepID=UPI001A287349|nr:pyrroline-5-carboxylate reductase [Mycolicibacterium sp.]MBJ7400195.1 pyrroline-5-carboxylate reductase [Mycolicibacterium sp.]